MKVHDYIQQNGLPLVRQYSAFEGPEAEGISELLVNPGEAHERFDIYSDPTGRHVVSINTTRNKFRVVHFEIAALFSEWLDVDQDHVLEPMSF